MDQNELPKYTNRLKDNYYNMGTINENIKYLFQGFLDNHFLNIVFIITIVLIYVYINIYSYYHSFIITLVIYLLFIITVIKFVFKSTNIEFIFGDRTEITNFSYLELVLAILITIILKIVFLSLVIDVLIYGRSQLIHYNAKNNYDMDNETKTKFYYYILFSTITSIVLFTCFSLLVFFKNNSHYKTKGYLFPLFILGLVSGMLVLEFIYSNYIHNIKKAGNKLYVIL